MAPQGAGCSTSSDKRAGCGYTHDVSLPWQMQFTAVDGNAFFHCYCRLCGLKRADERKFEAECILLVLTQALANARGRGSRCGATTAQAFTSHSLLAYNVRLRNNTKQI